tara:strand:+ start:79 stop:861 length:783 start_codon:yes stop_codon:yes gene_type:complete
MFFILSKILWLIFNPFSLFLIFFVFSSLLLIFKNNKIAKYLLLVNLTFILVISIFPIGKTAIYFLEKEYHKEITYPKNIHGILILAGATKPFLSKEHSSIELNSSAERLFESIFLINKYKDSKIIFSGGSGSLNKPLHNHSDVVYGFFNKLNVDIERVIFENKSRNTYENIINSKKISKPKRDENWILVTSASHMKRATLIAEKQDWIFYPYPVDFNQPKSFLFYPSLDFFNNVRFLQKASHEWLGLLSYYFMGRIEKIF